LIYFSSVALGAKVIATAGSLSKLEVCTKYGGADEALDYTKKDWPQEVMRITDGKGVGTIPHFLPSMDRHLTRCQMSSTIPLV
jgi:NADPH-dependent curcumin reductase CurA